MKTNRTPHFQVPFQLKANKVAVIEQNSRADVEQCVEAILRTPVGSRIEDLGFGRPDEEFSQLSADIGTEAYLSAIEEREPRARVLGTAFIEGLITKHVAIEVGGIDD